MKFGLHYQLPCSESQSPVQRYRDTLDQAVHAEALGFESVWPVEQHFNADLSIMPSPLLMLAALAERTTTLRLGIAIVLLPLSHPVRVAEEIATLDVLSNGRVEFGIGRGAIPSHFRGFGVNQEESRDRFTEEVEIILAAWSSERLTYHGRFFNLEKLRVVPKPVQQPHPPIRVAANSIETFELMGSMGLPIFAASQVNPFHKIREFLPLYRDARVAAGHPAASTDDITILAPLYVGESDAQIRRELEPSVERFLQTVSGLYGANAAPGGPSDQQPTDPGTARLKKMLDRMGRITYEKVCQNMGIFETPEACIERVRAYQQDYKMGRLICWFNPGGMVPHDRVMRSMELFAARVMPHFQD
jgi:alkanesulfonate monooxygenase SsuD/methylene tetrahydromethanopterin reductase-like flavin-dependent oxidoreductase (luciferase family)